MIDEYKDSQQLAYPGVYPDENDIIPYSPRRQFGFVQPNDMTLKLEQMREMSIDQIVELYKNGLRIEGASESSQIATAQGGITISGGTILLIGIGILTYMYIRKHPDKF
jgi:hypothetical protein